MAALRKRYMADAEADAPTARLGLEHTDVQPTPAQVRRAFRERALVLHPDKGGTPRAFSRIREAASALLDACGGDKDSDDDTAVSSGGQTRPREEVEVVQVRVPPSVAYLGGGLVRVRVPRAPLQCPAGCGGTGAERPEDVVLCLACRGQLGGCPQCTWAGRVFRAGARVCCGCRGLGSVPQDGEDEVEVHVPRGAEEGHVTSVGSRLFRLSMEPMPPEVLHNDGCSIVLDVPVPLLDALCGFERDVNVLGATSVKLVAGPCEAVHGGPKEWTTFGGQGMLCTTAGHARGALVLKVRVVWPSDAAQLSKLPRFRPVLERVLQTPVRQ